MTDLDDRLTRVMGALADAPLAEPEPVPALHRRARRYRLRRTLAGGTAFVVAFGALAGVLVVLRDNPDTTRDVQLLAPNVLLGDIDAVVLSNQFDEHGARTPIPAAVRDQVAAVPGVEGASGIVQRFMPLELDRMLDGTPPRTPLLFSYHEPSEVALVSGALPAAADEIIVNPDLAARYEVEVGDTLRLSLTGRAAGAPEYDDAGVTGRIVSGIFDVPGLDTTGVPLASLPATQPLEDGAFDRIDLAFAPAADPVAVQAAVAQVLSDPLVVLTPTELGLADQRAAEVDIQRAYWGLLSTDADERFAAREPGGTVNDDAPGNDGYESYRDVAANAELRVQRVEFLDADHATLVYRVYYGAGPSPIIDAPQTGDAVRVDGTWRIAAQTTCQLATYVAQTCEVGDARPLRTPDGWAAPDTEPQLAEVFRTLADPVATLEQRLAVVDRPDRDRRAVADGVAADAQYRDRVRFNVLGVRTSGSEASVLYSLATADGGPSTPYPLIARARRAGDRWVAPAQYACGISGLTNQSCGPETEMRLEG